MSVHGNTVAVKAGGDINPSRFVIGGAADHTVLEGTAAATNVVGVSGEGTQDAPQTGASALAAESGDHFQMHPFGDEALIETGGVVVRWTYGASDADGKAVTATTGQTANCLFAESAASGEKVRAMVISPYQIP